MCETFSFSLKYKCNYIYEGLFWNFMCGKANAGTQSRKARRCLTSFLELNLLQRLWARGLARCWLVGHAPSPMPAWFEPHRPTDDTTARQTTGTTERAMAGILFGRGAAPRLFAADAGAAWLGE